LQEFDSGSWNVSIIVQHVCMYVCVYGLIV